MPGHASVCWALDVSFLLSVVDRVIWNDGFVVPWFPALSSAQTRSGEGSSGRLDSESGAVVLRLNRRGSVSRSQVFGGASAAEVKTLRLIVSTRDEGFGECPFETRGSGPPTRLGTTGPERRSGDGQRPSRLLLQKR